MPDRKPEFPTPWRVEVAASGCHVRDAYGCQVIGVPDYVHGKAETERLARRIVAAVNAAEGRDGWPLPQKFRIGDMVRVTHSPGVGITDIGDVTIGGSYRVLGARVDMWRPGRVAYFLRGVLGLVPEDWLDAAEGEE